MVAADVDDAQDIVGGGGTRDRPLADADGSAAVSAEGGGGRSCALADVDAMSVGRSEVKLEAVGHLECSPPKARNL